MTFRTVGGEERLRRRKKGVDFRLMCVMEVKKPGTGACGGLAAARLARGMKHEDTAGSGWKFGDIRRIQRTSSIMVQGGVTSQ